MMKLKAKSSNGSKQQSGVKKQHLPFYLLKEYPSSILMQLQERIKPFHEEFHNNSSSIYQMETKSHQWAEKIESLNKAIKEMFKLIETLKKQARQIQLVKQQSFLLEVENKQLKEDFQRVQKQLQAHKQSTKQCIEDGLKEIKLEKEKSSMQLQDKNKQINQLNKQIEQQKLKNTNAKIEQVKIHERLQCLEKELHHKNQIISKITNEYCPVLCNNNFQTNSNTNSISKQASQPQQTTITTTTKTTTPEQQEISYECSIFHNISISQKIIAYLDPFSFTKLLSLNKITRTILIKSSTIMAQSYISLVRTKNREISYFHRHIEHYQKLSDQIPQQVIQNTFFQCNVLKQTMGRGFMQILNVSSQIFQGKMDSDQIKSVKEYIESKQIMHHFQMPQEKRYLKVDEKTVKNFFQERKIKKQCILKEIQALHHKIQETQELYQADTQTIQQFNQYLIKNFTIMFVLSKDLFTDVRNLQQLNNFLLGHLNQIDKFEIQKKYDLEDIKTELTSQRRLKAFLSEKCQKSQQRLLKQNKQNMQLQRAQQKLKNEIQSQQRQKQIVEEKLQRRNQDNQALQLKCKQIKRVYLRNKQKYAKLINQLKTVKQTIFKINMN